jgi:hypothetical protein
MPTHMYVIDDVTPKYIAVLASFFVVPSTVIHPANNSKVLWHIYSFAVRSAAHSWSQTN